VTRPLRVLHCPTAVAGNASSLARAERELGLESRAVALEAPPFGIETDEILFSPDDPGWKRELKRLRLLVRALRHFDIVHFNFGSTLTAQHPSAVGPAVYAGPRGAAYARYARLVELRDLPVLRRFGKGIVVTYQGDDARQGDVCAARFDVSPVGEVGPDYYTAAGDEAKRWRIARVSRYAHRIYALNPDLLHVLPERAEFLPYVNVDLAELTPVGRPVSSRPVVVHSPSARGVKGTRFVLDAVQELRRKGVDFEFRLVEGVPRSAARRLYEEADLAVDQLLVGWYGGFATEMMALGRPVIAYIREDDLAFVPRGMRAELPVVNATPTTISEVLEGCLTTYRSRLPELGARSRAFVESWHDPLRIAARLKRDYEQILARAAG